LSLPDLIEIVPITGPVRAEITVPGSKSITNRALVLAALADGITTLQGALWSEDTQVMVDCLQKLGFTVNVAPDPTEPCNRTITVHGQGGRVLCGGTRGTPLDLFVGNAGTAARFLAAMVCLGKGEYRLYGASRMHERPQAALFRALCELGYRIDSTNDRLPARFYTDGHRSGECTVSIAESSQFASALLLCAKAGGWAVTITGENAAESPYIEMTRQMVKSFPPRGGRFAIEPDASNGSYFWAAGWLLPDRQMEMAGNPADEIRPGACPTAARRCIEMPCGAVTVAGWPSSGWQIDANFTEYLPLPDSISRETQLGDSIMTAMVLAPFMPRPVRFTDLGRLRLQECERVAALRSELTKCGIEVLERGETLTVFPSAETVHGAEIETQNDHRMAMCFAILGLKVPGIKIKNPACVKKTFPNFFQKLATAPPHGLGVEIRDGATGRRLGLDELFAG
jgi:3-phosphoshikimate 1-carboxyvinyltransferase